MPAKVSEEKIYVATVGSKMRVCLPPNASKHISVVPKDYVTLIPDEDAGGPFLRIYPVKKDNFKLRDAKRTDTK